MSYYEYNDLIACKRHFKKIARDLCYGDKVIKKIDEAASVFEVELLMREQRSK